MATHYEDVCLLPLTRNDVHKGEDTSLEPSRIDCGEASCLALERDLQPAFFLTDDIRALPELEALANANVVISQFSSVRSSSMTSLRTRRPAHNWTN